MWDPKRAAADAKGEKMLEEWMREADRVGVDMRAAFPRLHQRRPSLETPISENTFEVTLNIDMSGIVQVLRRLPDGAGTDAFVDAYNSSFAAE